MTSPPAPNPGTQPIMYGELAEWWHLVSPVEDYVEEAEIYARILERHARGPLSTLLEIGSGGGNNASHLKARFQMTLVDRSPAMLAESRRVNPELVHVEGDMRTVRLERTFDAVFIHDAIDYMTSLADLRRAMETAYLHCRPGGVALFAPDHLRETFQPETSHGGSDGPERSLRYLEWTWDPDPGDTTALTDYIFVLRLPDGQVRTHHDRHEFGLFPRQAWLDTLADVGFSPKVVPFEHSELEPGTHELFVAQKP